MKATIKDGFLIREIADEKVLIGSGEQINFSKMLVLNDTAAYVVEELQKHHMPIGSDDLARGLSGAYEVDFAVALADVEELLRNLEAQGVVTVEV